MEEEKKKNSKTTKPPQNHTKNLSCTQHSRVRMATCVGLASENVGKSQWK
jgi:hypothetical protein